MKNKIFTFALLLLMSAAGVWAQNLPASIWSSPQSNTTEGRYRSNADNFIRPDQYTGVSFDKWFGTVSFLWDGDFSPVATAGFATKVSGLYIGAFYSGNFWAGKPANNYIEEEPASAPIGGVANKVYDVYSSPNVATGPVNNVALLIGAANMGFRITYRTNHQSFNKDGIIVGNQLYDNYQAENGYIAPQIAWALAKDLTKSGIRPYITFEPAFNRDYQRTKTANADAVITGERIGRSANNFSPYFTAGVGGYTVLNKDGFRLSADLDYELRFNIYNNEYSYVDGDVYKTANIKGTYNPGNSPYSEKSSMSNLVTPSLSGQWSKDRIALRFKFNLPLTFSSREDNSMGFETGSVSKLVYNGSSYSTSTFVFRPDLRLAMQYKIVPDKLTLNAGARIQATAVTLETVTDKYYINGERKSARNIHQNSFGSGFVSRFSIGPTFNFTENVWVEASTGVTNTYGDGAIDVFASGGLFSFGSILVGLKF